MDFLPFANHAVSVLALVISLFACWQSYRATKLAQSFERSAALSEIYDRMRPGRQAMHAIWDGWTKENKSLLCPKDREEFITYYNAEFHTASQGSEERRLSDGIHALMHDLDRLSDRVAAGEFAKEQALRSFGHAIAMDYQLILTYLDAHWKHHRELKKNPDSRFWHNVPAIAAEANDWSNRIAAKRDRESTSTAARPSREC